MPELPEVETVRRTLLSLIKGSKITNVDIKYNRIIEYPKVEEFKKEIIGQRINDMQRRGKILIFELDDYLLLSHLRMEGRYYLKKINDEHQKHEHVIFTLDKKEELRYIDTRKFGRMYLYPKDVAYISKPISQLGLEPFDDKLTVTYLKNKYKKKTLPIKTVLLDQSIITGIGNIYDDEILFKSKINPLKKASELTDTDLENIIKYTKEILKSAIELGGSTIHSYESAEGVTGKFQNELLVHTKEGTPCKVCGTKIVKIKVNGRGTYYCPNCQK